MENTKHTPEQWHWMAVGPTSVIVDSNACNVAAQPDKRAVAIAAPDLLDALKKMLDAYRGQVTRFGTYGHEIDQAIAAIAKATAQ